MDNPFSLNNFSRPKLEMPGNEKKLYKVFTTPLLKDFNKLFDSKMTKNNLYNTFGKNETNNQNDFNETIQKYENYIKFFFISYNKPSIS